MMKHEFESLYGYEVTPKEYKKIEFCYMQLDNLIKDKKDIVNLYNKLGSDLFDRLYMDIGAFKQHVDSESEEVDRLYEENCALKNRIGQLESFISNVDFVLSNNVKYVNSMAKDLLGYSVTFQNESEGK